jgi:hypothetical protein
VCSETDLRKIDFCKSFIQFFVFFSVKRLDGHSWRPDGWRLVVQMGSGYVRTHAATNGQTVRILVRTHATCPHGSEAVRVRTALIRRPDGDPTGPIYSWSPHILYTPPKISFWHLVSYFLRAFRFILLLFVFFHLSHISGIFLVFFFSVYLFLNC